MSYPGKITTHVADALDRLLQQYRDLPRVTALITAFVDEVQDLENALADVYDGRWIDLAVGDVLDDVGTIVNQPRLGFDDDRYRSLIRAKIGQNVSQGDPERVIQVAKLLIGASLVHLQELYPAGYSISADADIPVSLVNLFYEQLDLVDPAGVRLEYLICFDPDEAFAFEGGPGTALGFGDSTNPLTGGMLAKVHVRTEPAFAFAPVLGSIISIKGSEPWKIIYTAAYSNEEILINGKTYK